MTDAPASLSIIEIFEVNLFVDVDSLLANIVIATKSPDGLIDWIELKPEFHGSLVKCALRLVSKHTETFKTASAKEALFPFLINLLNSRDTCTALFHKNTATASKRTNREKKRNSENIAKSKIQKTSPVQALLPSEGIHPPPDPAIIIYATSPTPSSHPPTDPEVTPQAQDPVVDEPEADESGCPGIHTHPACGECYCSRPAAGLKYNRFPKCTVHRFRKDGTYPLRYEDYPCHCVPRSTSRNNSDARPETKLT
jgi:hypothetical protein